MSSRFFLSAVAAAVLAAACSPKVSDQTTIKGTFEAEAPESVEISIPDAGIDTTIAVENGKFALTLPALVRSLATISAGSMKVPFISDGTTLTMTFKEMNGFEIESNIPQLSVQAKSSAYDAAVLKLEEETEGKYNSIEDKQGEEAKAIIEAYDKAMLDIDLETFKANTDNILGARVLKNLQYEVEVAKLDSLVAELDPAMDESSDVVKIKKALKNKLATSEGKMFTDFEIGGAKLSDYVGKGKFVLVDFWASWCGPCKREIPNIKNVYEKYAGEDFDVLSVSVWDNPQATVDTAKVYGVSWNAIVGDQERNATTIYGIQGIPHIILFGPDGTIVKRDLREEGIEEEVAKHVKAKK